VSSADANSSANVNRHPNPGTGGGGGPLGTRSVGADTAVAEPAAFVAVTRTSSRAPPSVGWTAYVAELAQGVGAHVVAVASQLSHWYA
jgi:hypothetical protein